MVSHEQKVYAGWLDWGTRAGLALLIATFAAYASGLVAPFVPLESLAALWSLPAEDYRAATGAPTGWGWLALLRHGDYLSLLAIALLALCTVACYLRILPLHLKRREHLPAVMVLAQIAVLVAAASGALA